MLSAVRRALIAIALAIASGGACGGNDAAPPAAPGSPAPAPSQTNEERFSGTITEIDFGCAADRRCWLVVDGGKRVAFGHDTRGQPPAEWGSSDALFELMEEPQQGVGRRVEVYAAKDPGGGYTLRGKSAYYVKVLP